MNTLVELKKVDPDTYNAIVKSKVVQRREIIKNELEANPYVSIGYLAVKADSTKMTIKNDIDRLIKDGFQPAIERNEMVINQKVQNQSERSLVETAVTSDPYAEHSELAGVTGIPLDRFKKHIQSLTDKQKQTNVRNERMARNKENIRTLFKQNVHGSVYDVAKSAGVPIEKLKNELKIYEDDVGELENSLRLDALLSYLAEIGTFCFEQVALCIVKDPGKGTRWVEEGRKLFQLYADLSGMQKTKEMEINLNVTNKTKEERDRIFNASVIEMDRIKPKIVNETIDD